MLREFFGEIKRHHGITGKAISEQTGISQNHISEYINGKRDVTTDVLWRMLEAMDEISPGARRDLAKRIAGDRPEITYEELDEDELAEEMIKLGRAWKTMRNRKLVNAN
jgi:transcriptional regulator with XRE-family HTH domain